MEISDEDCPLVLPVSELPLDKVFGEVSVRLVDWELEVPLAVVDLVDPMVEVALEVSLGLVKELEVRELNMEVRLLDEKEEDSVKRLDTMVGFDVESVFEVWLIS